MAKRGRPPINKPACDHDEHQYVGHMPTPEEIARVAAQIRAENAEQHRKTPCKSGRSEPREYRDPRRAMGLL